MAHNKIYVINAFNHTHQWGTWIAITPATCTTEGVETRNCLLDAAHTETRASAINPNAHQWGVYRVLIQATETTDGAETRTCSRDSSHIETRTGAAALGHVWGDWTVTNAATETDDGEESITCTICGEVKEICFSGEYATGTPGLWSGDNITVSDGAVIIGKVNSSIARGDAVIPAYVLYEGGYLPVTSIGDSAFSSCYNLTSITIPAGVTSISQSAFFGCSSLTSITIPAGVTSISDNAFYYCSRLTSVTIPASVTSIGSNAFSNWTSSQTINVQGYASQAAADAAWGSNWRENCTATIKYWNGSSYQ